jgi:hypothetical protein
MPMQGWRSGRGRWFALAGLLGAVVGIGAAGAQQTTASASETQGTAGAQQAKTAAQKTPTLGEILQQLQENVDQYQALVPSFFCDEHVVSTVIPDPKHESTVTDSTFRLKRVADPNDEGKTILEESHEVKMVNGRPATGDIVGGPAYLRGAFSNGLTMVMASKQAYMRYSLKTTGKDKPGDAITVQFASLPERKRADDCGVQEEVSGRVQIDPESMQVTHVEFTVPRHLVGSTLVPTSPVYSELGLAIEPIVGRWSVTVEYAPVVLGGKSFWLPTKISDNIIGSSVRKRWTYDATYSNYHKMEVTSRIVPDTQAPVK